MTRTESKAIMGYLPIEERHYPALLSLVTPATPAHHLLDPFAGEGAFLEVAMLRPTRTGGDVKMWTVTLDVDAWTRLITGGLAEGIIQLPGHYLCDR
ncbi:MAG: hypothetical protein K8I60_06640 [Anaerolineae bacterium]|nr:hypothetical protein [Anaerolineae bacterium]